MQSRGVGMGGPADHLPLHCCPPETTFRDFPSDQPMTDGWTVPEKRKWMLAPLYRDIVLKKGEIDALEGGWHQVANDHLGKGERLFIVP